LDLIKNMKNLLFFPVNSFVGLTTNSSSELFIATSNETTSEEIDEMLLNLFKEFKVNNPEITCGMGITKSKILNTPQEIADNLLPAIRWYMRYYGSHLKNILFSIYGLYLPEVDDSASTQDFISHFLNINQNQTLKRPMVIIKSTGDNSISWPVVEIIENYFLHCERVHLG